MIDPVFQQTGHHKRIKIFNNNGFDQANIKISYRTDKTISIKNFHAQTYNLDATGNIIITKVDKAVVYDKQVNKRFTERIFAFPEIKEGSIIEYEYVLDGASEGEWYFQKSIPVAYSRFIVNFPQEIRVAAIPHCSMKIQRGTDTKASDNYTWFAMEELPALANEPFMSCREDYLQRLDIQITAYDFPGRPLVSALRTWPGIIKELVEDEDFGRQLKKNIPRTSELDKMLQGIKNPLQKMKIIHQYVRSNMQWNGIDNIWALEGVKNAWKDKKGTSGEINLILINLLKDADLKARPVLLSSRENGVVNTSTAGYDQFNKVMAYVEIDAKHYVLDATEKITPPQLIPLNVIASEGLVIEKPDNLEWGWKTLWDENHKFEKKVFISSDIDEKGKRTGTASVNSYDYEKIEALDILKKGKDKLQETITKQGITIDSFMVAGAENDTLPLTVDFKFSAPTSSSGVYHYFTANYFAGFDKNPFLADERQTDIFFGALQDYSISALIYLPQGYTMDVLPKNLKLITSDTNIVFTRYSSYNDGLLNIQTTLIYKSPYFTTDAYPELVEFYKKMYAMLNEQFVYKKNN
jgi:hypothetical protein